MILILIPARQGSKRIPGKNTMFFNGRPLVEYTIEQARKLEFADKIILSTDDEGLLKYPEAEKRPDILCTDIAPIQEEVNRLWKKYHPDILIMLQCTTPQRTMGDILSAYSIFKDNPNCKSLVSVNPDYKPNGAIQMTRTGIMYDSPVQLYFTKTYYIDIDYIWDFKIAEAILRNENRY